MSVTNGFDIATKAYVGAIIPSSTSATVLAQTAANTNILTYTVGGSDSSFLVSMNVRVTTATTHSFNGTVSYTDAGNNARVLLLNFTVVAGTVSVTIADGGGAVPYHGIPSMITAKAGTDIVFKTAGTFTAVVYEATASIVSVA